MLRELIRSKHPTSWVFMHASFAHTSNRALINRREKIAMRFPIDVVLIARQEPEFLARSCERTSLRRSSTDVDDPNEINSGREQ
jgi:hypothetical protein